MSKNEKIWIILLVAVVVIVIALIIGISRNGNKEEIQKGAEQVINEEKYTTELADGTKINTSEEFNNSKTYGKLEISNIQYTEKNGMSVLLADVTNKGNTKHEPEIVKITIIGENGETIKINASITADVANAKDFKIDSVN